MFDLNQSSSFHLNDNNGFFGLSQPSRLYLVFVFIIVQEVKRLIEIEFRVD